MGLVLPNFQATLSPRTQLVISVLGKPCAAWCISPTLSLETHSTFRAEPLPRWRCRGWGSCTGQLAHHPAQHHLQMSGPTPPLPPAPAEQSAPVGREGQPIVDTGNHWETAEFSIKYTHTSLHPFQHRHGLGELSTL